MVWRAVDFTLPKKVYAVVALKMSRPLMVQECASMGQGGSLATIDTEEELALFKGIIFFTNLI